MAIVGAIAAVASVGVAAYGTVQSGKAASRAREDREKQNSIATARERRNAIQEARIKRGRVINTSVQAGGQGGSGEAGSTGSIGSQLAQNLSFLDSNLQLSNSISANMSRAQTYQGIAKLGMTTFNAVGGGAAVGKAFKSTPATNNIVPLSTHTV